jgi:Flp pilus assembly pilin Flp
MKRYWQRTVRRFKRGAGQGLVEYSLILALIAIVAILVLRGIGRSTNRKLSNVNSNLR